MPRYHRLRPSVDDEPWSLNVTVQLERALEALERRHLSGVPLEGLEEPLRLDVEGRTEASLMERGRGRLRTAVRDLIVSPALADLLSRATLPRHAALDCSVFAYPKGSFGVLPKSKKPKGPLPYRWLWWTENPGEKIDPTRSRWRLRYMDGTTVETGYPSLDHYEAAWREGASTSKHTMAVLDLEWADPAMEGLDLVPLPGGWIFVSPSLAQELRTAQLPGLEVRPPL